jgi:regulator of replication initiation timing
MATHSKRYTNSDVRLGKFQLPAKLKWLCEVKYLAVVNRHTDEKETWAIEFQPTTAKKLVLANALAEKSNANVRLLSHENEKLRNKIEELENNLNSVTGANSALEAVNAKLMKNIEEDRTPDKFNKSQKSALNAVIERGTDLAKKPYQGGKAGL